MGFAKESKGLGTQLLVTKDGPKQFGEFPVFIILAVYKGTWVGQGR